jgi:hypothetical protein
MPSSPAASGSTSSQDGISSLEGEGRMPGTVADDAAAAAATPLPLPAPLECRLAPHGPSLLALLRFMSARKPVS